MHLVTAVTFFGIRRSRRKAEDILQDCGNPQQAAVQLLRTVYLDADWQAVRRQTDRQIPGHFVQCNSVMTL